MGRYAYFCCLASAAATLLGGCATSNGIPPAGNGQYPVPAHLSQQHLYPEPGTRLLPLGHPVPAIPEQSLRLRKPVGTSTFSENKGIPSARPPAMAPALELPRREAAPQPQNFPILWQQDLAAARHGSAGCAAMAGVQKTSCWQEVAAWAKERAGTYGQLATHLSGARSQQALSAMKFFAVTSQWAGACSTLSTMACAQSPLIAKMQQWKASVGLPAQPG